MQQDAEVQQLTILDQNHHDEVFSFLRNAGLGFDIPKGARFALSTASTPFL
jgi:hypothetical protein